MSRSPDLTIALSGPDPEGPSLGAWLLHPRQLGSFPRVLAEAAAFVTGCWLLATPGHGCGHIVDREGTLARDKSCSPGIMVPCPSMPLN